MKNIIFKPLEYLYYFSLVVLLILYLFPGSLIGYLLYGNLGQQPDLIPNPIGTSINHLIFFSYITLLALILRSRTKNILTNFKTLIISKKSFLTVGSPPVILILLTPNKEKHFDSLLISSKCRNFLVSLLSI